MRRTIFIGCGLPAKCPGRLEYDDPLDVGPLACLMAIPEGLLKTMDETQVAAGHLIFARLRKAL
jgi:hypothetical protein